MSDGLTPYALDDDTGLSPYSLDEADEEALPSAAVNAPAQIAQDDGLSPYSLDEPDPAPSLSAAQEQTPIDDCLSPYSLDTEDATSPPGGATPVPDSPSRQSSRSATPARSKSADVGAAQLLPRRVSTSEEGAELRVSPGTSSTDPARPRSNSFHDKRMITADPSLLFRSVFDDPEASTSHDKSESGPRNWNSEFQSLLDRQPSRERTVALRDLAHDFVHASKKYGKIIISEKNLPDEMKTIKRLGGSGGSAGGIKYVHHGIFFKFATDWKNLYGGDHYAMKSASHELTSLMRFYGSSKLRVPMMCIIDYHGYRLVAMSILPLKEMLYGSGDAGAHIKTDPEVHQLMGEVAKKLNIAEHRAGAVQVPIYGPCDIEVHRGFDKRLYVLDFARVFPPTRPIKNQRGSHLFYLFRPEFCKNYRVPLSSDAYSRMGRADKAYHNKNCSEATDLLLHKCAELAMELDTTQKRPFQLKEIMQTIHGAGINFRYLGVIRSHSTDPDMRLLLFIEMVGRLIKRELWYNVRQITTYLSEETLRAIFCNYLNQIVLSKNVERGNEFWLRSLPQMLSEVYGEGAAEDMFSDTDIDSYRLLSTINLLVLFQRLEDNMRISFTNSALRSLAEDPMAFELVYCDIKRVGAKVKTTNLLLLAEGNDLHEQMNEREGAPSTRLFALALKSYTRAMNATPDDENVCNQYAQLLFDYCVKQLSKVGIRALTQTKDQEKEHTPLGLCRQVYSILHKTRNYTLMYSMGMKMHGMISAFSSTSDGQYYDALEKFVGVISQFFYQVQENKSDLVTASLIADLNVLLCTSALQMHEIEKGTAAYTRAGEQYRKALQNEAEMGALMKEYKSWVMNLSSIELAQVVRLCLLDPELSLISNLCPFLSDSLLEVLSQNVPQITVLQLHESPITCTFTSKSITSIIKKHGPTLVDVRVSFPVLLDQIFAKCTQLERLTLHSTRDRDIKRHMKKLGSLISLDLSWTAASDDNLSKILKKANNLRELYLDSAKVKGKCIKEFGSQMRTVSLKACSTLEGRNVQYLSKSCPNLEELYLSDCNLTDESVKALASCVHLKRLTLSGNQNLTTQSLREVALHCKSIQVLELATLARAVTNELLQLIAANMPDLQELNLNSCYNITDEALVSLKSCKQLSKLSIVEARNMTNSGIKAVASLPLRYLCIDYCSQITDGILALKRCHTLEEFSLQGLNKLTDEHILAFFADMRNCTLKSMNVTSCLNFSQGLIDRIQHRYPSLQLHF